MKFFEYAKKLLTIGYVVTIAACGQSQSVQNAEYPPPPQ